MLSSTLRASSRVAASQAQRRGMAGYPATFAVKKNPYVEEWNGKREITEKTFEVGFGEVGTFIAYILVLPLGIYAWTRSEFISRGDDPRYKDLL